MTEPTPDVVIKPMVNNLVTVSIPEEVYPSDRVYEIAEELLEAAYRSRALAEIDRVMHEHRRQWIPSSPEWLLVDRAWRDLRVPFGWETE